MKFEAYEAESKLEADHWWFVVRRDLFKRFIGKLGLRQDADILDIGTSTGTNLRMLVDLKFNNIRGLDYSDHAIEFCRQKGLPAVTKGDICDMPFEANSMDLVVATDIVEHVEDDQKALDEIHRILKPGGHALLTVPMFMSLWGPQDDISLHQRRYRRTEFRNLIRSENFEIQKAFFFNFLLFLPIWLARLILNRFKQKIESENDINNPFMNSVFKLIFKLDTLMAPLIHPPFGVSYFCLLKKKTDVEG